MNIDVTMGTLGRFQQFKRAIFSLNNQKNAKDLILYIMDGNPDVNVKTFLNGRQWKFKKYYLIKEQEALPAKDMGLWPKIYNYLMKMGKSELVTYWSDDIYPEEDCLFQGVKKFNDHQVGAVAFNWRDGDGKPYKIYGTEMHKQTMVNFGLFRRTVLEKVNFIDDKYNFYNADQDLSLKVWYIGYKVVRCPESKVTHHSGKKSDNKYRNKDYYRDDSVRFAKKWAYNNVRKRNVEL